MRLRRLLLVDSYDSFSYNIAHALASLNAAVDVLPVDEPIDALRFRSYDAIVLGPGPGAPRRDGPLRRVIERTLDANRPLLGICLGMQAIARHYGGCVVRAPRPVHGEQAVIEHDGQGLFAGIASPLRAARYHSLCVERGSLAESIRERAASDDGVLQAIEDGDRPVFGLQFHPESFLSENGEKLLGNFLKQVRR